VTLSGTLSGTTFTASSAGDDYVVNGTFDKAAGSQNLQLDGTLRDNIKNRDVQLGGRLPGCRLNCACERTRSIWGKVAHRTRLRDLHP
jgi:hypothetical protein